MLGRGGEDEVFEVGLVHGYQRRHRSAFAHHQGRPARLLTSSRISAVLRPRPRALTVVMASVSGTPWRVKDGSVTACVRSRSGRFTTRAMRPVRHRRCSLLAGGHDPHERGSPHVRATPPSSPSAPAMVESLRSNCPCDRCLQILIPILHFGKRELADRAMVTGTTEGSDQTAP